VPAACAYKEAAAVDIYFQPPFHVALAAMLPLAVEKFNVLLPFIVKFPLSVDVGGVVPIPTFCEASTVTAVVVPLLCKSREPLLATPVELSVICAMFYFL
jgi:hypothetical protein